jgi:hypothetical protein
METMRKYLKLNPWAIVILFVFLICCAVLYYHFTNTKPTDSDEDKPSWFYVLPYASEGCSDFSMGDIMIVTIIYEGKDDKFYFMYKYYQINELVTALKEYIHAKPAHYYIFRLAINRETTVEHLKKIFEIINSNKTYNFWVVCTTILSDDIPSNSFKSTDNNQTDYPVVLKNYAIYSMRHYPCLWEDNSCNIVLSLSNNGRISVTINGENSDTVDSKFHETWPDDHDIYNRVTKIKEKFVQKYELGNIANNFIPVNILVDPGVKWKHIVYVVNACEKVKVGVIRIKVVD